jgi:hypothetical protein
MLKRDADRTSDQTHGAAVVELIEAILADDLRGWAQRISRRAVLLGHRDDRSPVCAAPARCNVLIAGPSGSGKSVYASGILERLAEKGYQYCAIDAEGDYADLPGAVVLGSAEREASPEEVLTALENPHTNVVVNLSGLAAEERPAAFKELITELATLRATCGRPHWILVSEAHLLLPADDADGILEPQKFGATMLYVSVHPESMSASVLDSVDTVIAIGANPVGTMAKFCGPLGIACPAVSELSLRHGEAAAWERRSGESPYRFALQPSEAERKQHRRRLVEGQLPPERSFYFRGAQKKLNLRAQNLPLFLQMAVGVDEDTWLHHLRQGDYSRWLQESVKDARLATAVAEVERSEADAPSSLARVTSILEKFMQAVRNADPQAG